MSDWESKAFEDAAARPEASLVRELWDLVRHTKKWWLLPLLVALLLAGGLVLLSGSAAAPLIYTLF